MNRTWILVIGIILVVTACSSGEGGSDPTDPPSVPAGEASEPAGGDDATPAPDDGDDDPLATFRDEEASARVMIGDQTFEFAGLYCVTLGGALGAASVGTDPTVNIDIPPADWETSTDDWDPPSIRLSSDEPYFDFQAGPEAVEFYEGIEPGMSQVDSFETDGYRVTGTATFVDVAIFGEAPQPVTGSFEVTCPRP